MDLNLKDKNAFVCGSTQGIGRACAQEIATLGANVTLIARNEEKLKATLALLDTTQGQEHDYFIYDFSDSSNLKASVENYLQTQNKTVHILINNTGGPPGGPIANADIQEFLQAFNNHLICNHLLTQATLPGMQTAKYGRIINIISTSVKIPITGLGVSNTTRGAVANWAKTLANEVSQYGITVNNLLPGFTETQRLFSIIENKAKKAGVSPENMNQKMADGVPMKRFAKAEEIASVVAFLASPAASYINGVSLAVDGGRTGCH